MVQFQIPEGKDLSIKCGSHLIEGLKLEVDKFLCIVIIEMGGGGRQIIKTTFLPLPYLRLATAL